VNDPSILPAFARNAMFQHAAHLLSNGDFISFKRLAGDLEGVGLHHSFLGGLLSNEARKLWISDESFRLDDTSICGGSSDGDVVVQVDGVGFNRVRAAGSFTRGFISDRRWQRWSRGGASRSDGDLPEARCEGVVWQEAMPIGPSGRLLQMSVAPGKAEIACVKRLVGGAGWTEVWRTVLEYSEGEAWCCPRALWAHDDRVLVALRTREVVALDAASGRQIARGVALPELQRILDFHRSKGVLVECAAVPLWDGPRVEVGILDPKDLSYARVSARSRSFNEGQLVTGAWHGDGFVLVLAGPSGSVVSRSERYIWATRTAARERRDFKSELYRGMLAECDARLAGQPVNPDYDFGRSISLVRIPKPPSVEGSVDHHAVLNAEFGEVLHWSPRLETASTGDRRIIGLRTEFDVPETVWRGVSGAIWIANDGHTALLSDRWGFDAVDLRTADRVGGFAFNAGMIRVMHGPLYEGIAPSQFETWSTPDHRTGTLEPNGYPEPDRVWYSSSANMVIATWRWLEYSIGLSLDDGNLYLYNHDEFRWISVDATGRSLFARWDGVYEIGFGKVASVRCVQRFSRTVEDRREGVLGWAFDGSWYIADGSAWTPLSTRPLSGTPSQIERVLAISSTTRAMLVRDDQSRYVVLTLSEHSGLLNVNLEVDSIAFREPSTLVPGECWAFSPDGFHVVSRTKEGLCFWCVETGRVVSHFSAPSHSFGPNGLCFTPSGSRLVVSLSEELEIWHAGGGHGCTMDALSVRSQRAKCFERINQMRVHSGKSAACMFSQRSVPEWLGSDGIPALQRGIYAAREGWLDHPECFGEWAPKCWF
jgi:hypothetical protein